MKWGYSQYQFVTCSDTLAPWGHLLACVSATVPNVQSTRMRFFSLYARARRPLSLMMLPAVRSAHGVFQPRMSDTRFLGGLHTSNGTLAPCMAFPGSEFCPACMS